MTVLQINLSSFAALLRRPQSLLTDLLKYWIVRLFVAGVQISKIESINLVSAGLSHRSGESENRHDVLDRAYLGRSKT